MRPNNVHRFAIPVEDISKFSFANAYGFLQHGFKHRLKIAGRATDNLQHLRCGSLLLQRFSKLTRAFLLRLKQSGVLDGDYRLVSECLDQLDLLLGERTYGCALKDQHTYWNPLAQKRHAEECAIVAESRGFKEGVFRV